MQRVRFHGGHLDNTSSYLEGTTVWKPFVFADRVPANPPDFHINPLGREARQSRSPLPLRAGRLSNALRAQPLVGVLYRVFRADLDLQPEVRGTLQDRLGLLQATALPQERSPL